MARGPIPAMLAAAAAVVLLGGCDDGVTKYTGDALTDTTTPDVHSDTTGDTLPASCVTDHDCDDGEFCNGAETCSEDGCQAGVAPVEGTECETGSGAAGQCRLQRCVGLSCGDALVDDGEECDDANLVTADGCEFDCTFSCHGDGECALDGPCVAGVCAEGGTGRLCATEMLEGPCDDGDPCTEGDFCADGVCVPGTAVCVCSSDADCAEFDDGDLCNGTMFCQEGVCVVDPATVVRCDAPPPGSCMEAQCNPATGLCETSALPDGTDCEDGDLCTGPDTCHAGDCVGGPALECDTIGPCHEAFCDPAEGCVTEVLVGAPCEDGDACTEGETCSAEGACTGGAPLDCDDGDDCTDDVCDPSAGCYHSYNEAPCNDGNPCTDDDHCFMGHCTGDELPVAYADGDGDGFGNAWETICTDVLPEGFSWENGDCCDIDAEIFPGQPRWFTESYICDDIGMPDFDYDCSGSWETRFNDLGECVASSGGTCVTRAGWLPDPTGTSIPGCGDEGMWLTSCVHTTMGCAPMGFETLPQECH